MAPFIHALSLVLCDFPFLSHCVLAHRVMFLSLCESGPGRYSKLYSDGRKEREKLGTHKRLKD